MESALKILSLSPSQSKESPIISLNSEDEFLSKLLYPMSLTEFFQDIYRKKALAITNSRLSRFRPLIRKYLFNLSVEELLENTASDEISVWVVNKDTSKISSFKTDNPKIALTCYSSGAALYFRSSEAFQNFIVKRASKDLHMHAFANYGDGMTRGEVEIFIAKQGHFTDVHFDFQENFTVQLKGQKRWLLKSGLSSPIRGYTPHYAAAGNSDEQLKLHQLCNYKLENVGNQDEFPAEVILKPGDVFYHPAGIYHAVECNQESISINLSLSAVSNLEILLNTLRQEVLRHNDLRSHFQAHSREQAAAQFKELKLTLTNALDRLEPESMFPDTVFDDSISLISIDTDTAPSYKLARKYIKLSTSIVISLLGHISDEEREMYSMKYGDQNVHYAAHVHPCMDETTQSLKTVGIQVQQPDTAEALEKFINLDVGTSFGAKILGPKASKVLPWLIFLGCVKQA
jgi:ribosomal protein L16 Arg81 hydroxylase